MTDASRQGAADEAARATEQVAEAAGAASATATATAAATADPVGSPADVTRLQAEVDELKDRLLRERADLDNFKKRMLRERAEASKYANESLLRDLVPILDNLERAVAAGRQPGAKETPNTGGALGSLIEGIDMVIHGFSDTLARFGVTRISAVGEAFDPAKHEALAQVEADHAAPGAVIDEHQPGYMLHDRLLRPAQVTVAKARVTGGANGSPENSELNHRRS